MKVCVRQGRASGGHRSCSPKFVVVLLALGLASTAYAETNVIDSGIDGNGDGLDDTVRYLAGASGTPSIKGYLSTARPSAVMAVVPLAATSRP